MELPRYFTPYQKKEGLHKPHNSYSSIIASTLTVGFGGSVGLESPVVVTGSSMGSNLGRLFGMNYKSIITLIGCGAAGAIAGIFKAPVAGVVFAVGSADAGYQHVVNCSLAHFFGYRGINFLSADWQ